MGPQKRRRSFSAQFLAHLYCGQKVGCIKMPLRMEVGLSPGDFVLDGHPALLPKKETKPPPVCGPCVLWPNCCIDQDSTWYRGGPWSRPHCARWGPSSPPQKGSRAPSHFSAHVHCGQTAGWIKMALGTGMGLGASHILLHEDPAPLPKKGAEPFPPNFRPIFIVAKRLDASSCHLVWR